MQPGMLIEPRMLPIRALVKFGQMWVDFVHLRKYTTRSPIYKFLDCPLNMLVDNKPQQHIPSNKSRKSA